ncbi:MAG: type II toxin-antitoxin system RelB/DinJ family antitoxin [Patescibacteria group bacterium]
MNTTVINIRTQPDVKKAAQQVAEDLGMNLSVLINGFLKNLIKTKTINLNSSEEPSEYLINSIREAKEDIKNGEVSPLFENADEAIAWLNDKDKKYEYQIRKKVR